MDRYRRWRAGWYGGAVLLLGMISMIWALPEAEACSPEAWSYHSLAEKSEAILYGEVVAAHQEGRQAVLRVIRYVGEGVAPQTASLPATRSSQRTLEDMCPDLSTRFEPGREYLVFLKQDGPEPVLLNESFTTALPIEAGLVVEATHNARSTADQLLEETAHIRGITVQSPPADAPSWGMLPKPRWGMIGAAMTAASLGLVILLRILRARRRG
ncbi:hypothetical protein WMW72_21195 [Paenibacillus filicis]|uniref:Uncharacterized protein n=1 Tax=Paenibacillus filicis TaxID=669464 RepID=A0ABU9DQR6_9BACL